MDRRRARGGRHAAALPDDTLYFSRSTWTGRVQALLAEIARGSHLPS
ncbi:hypothetical protein [Cellulomonas soli]